MRLQMPISKMYKNVPMPQDQRSNQPLLSSIQRLQNLASMTKGLWVDHWKIYAFLRSALKLPTGNFAKTIKTHERAYKWYFDFIIGQVVQKYGYGSRPLPGLQPICMWRFYKGWLNFNTWKIVRKSYSCQSLAWNNSNWQWLLIAEPSCTRGQGQAICLYPCLRKGVFEDQGSNGGRHHRWDLGHRSKNPEPLQSLYGPGRILFTIYRKSESLSINWLRHTDVDPSFRMGLKKLD